MFGSRVLDTSPSSRRALSSLLELSGRYAVTPAHLRCMDSASTSESEHGSYVSLAELAAQLKVPVQTIYDLRSKGSRPSREDTSVTTRSPSASTRINS